MVSTITKDLKTITKNIKSVVPESEVYLFGSYAYGKPSRNSDLDIFIVCPDKSIRKIDILKKVRKTFSRKVNIPVDLVIVYNDEFEERKQHKATLENKVANEGVKL